MHNKSYAGMSFEVIDGVTLSFNHSYNSKDNANYPPSVRIQAGDFAIPLTMDQAYLLRDSLEQIIKLERVLDTKNAF